MRARVAFEIDAPDRGIGDIVEWVSEALDRAPGHGVDIRDLTIEDEAYQP